jgi:hypothetical protein
MIGVIESVATIVKMIVGASVWKSREHGYQLVVIAGKNTTFLRFLFVEGFSCADGKVP